MIIYILSQKNCTFLFSCTTLLLLISTQILFNIVIIRLRALQRAQLSLKLVAIYDDLAHVVTHNGGRRCTDGGPVRRYEVKSV